MTEDQEIRAKAIEIAATRIGGRKMPAIVAEANRLAEYIRTGVLPELPAGQYE